MKKDIVDNIKIEETLNPGNAELEVLKRNINRWAKAIKFNPYQTLGDKIKIRRMKRYAMFCTSLYTQAESRLVSRKETSYAGEKLPPMTVKSINDVDPWKAVYPVPQSFVNMEKQYMVDGSECVIRCSRCGGNGKNTCPKCGGKGSFRCGGCGGSGKVPRYEKCWTCGGSGQVSKYVQERVAKRGVNGHYDRVDYTYETVMKHETCPHCGGTGKQRAGNQNCPKCGGSGYISCSTCGGSGNVTCSLCKGRGKTLSYIAVNRKLEKFYASRYDSAIEVQSHNEKIAFLFRDSDYTTLENVRADNGKLKNTFSDIPLAGDAVGILLSLNHGKSGNASVIFEQVVIKKTSFVQVEYEFEGEDYVLYVSPGGLIYAPYSPVDKYSEGILDKILKHAKFRSLYKALGQAKVFCGLKQYDDKNIEGRCMRNFMQSVSYKMQADVYYGAHFFMILIAVLSVPFSYWYYKNVSFVAPWIDLKGVDESWISYIYPLFYVALSAWCTFHICHYPKFENVGCKVRTMLLRFLVGGGMALASFAACMLVLAFAHFLLLPAFWELIGDIIDIPISIIVWIWEVLDSFL